MYFESNVFKSVKRDEIKKINSRVKLIVVSMRETKKQSKLYFENEEIKP